MKKRISAALLALCLCAALLVMPAAAADGIQVQVNGAYVQWTDAAPFIDENSRTLVPLRAVAEAMNLEVSWNGEFRYATFSGYYGEDYISVVFYIDDPRAIAEYRHGPEESPYQQLRITMDTTAQIRQDRTYAPIRYLAEQFGYTVSWQGETKTVGLQQQPAPEPVTPAVPKETVDQAYHDYMLYAEYYQFLKDTEQLEDWVTPGETTDTHIQLDINKDGIDELIIQKPFLGEFSCCMIFTYDPDTGTIQNLQHIAMDGTLSSIIDYYGSLRWDPDTGTIGFSTFRPSIMLFEASYLALEDGALQYHHGFGREQDPQTGEDHCTFFDAQGSHPITRQELDTMASAPLVIEFPPRSEQFS